MDALTLLVIIYSACGSKLTSFPADGINILVELDVVPLLATLAADFQVSLFCGPLIDGSLHYIFKEDDDGRFSKVVQFLENMIDGIRFSSKDSICVIKYVLTYCTFQFVCFNSYACFRFLALFYWVTSTVPPMLVMSAGGE